jgi:hypothetical protein
MRLRTGGCHSLYWSPPRAVDEQPRSRRFACGVVHNSRYFPSLTLKRQVCAHAHGRIAFAWKCFSPRWPAEITGGPMCMRILASALSLVVASGVACAQSDPRPKSATSPDVGARIAAMYSQCMQDWDAGTHLTKQEWERTCRRLMQERGKSACANANSKVGACLGLEDGANAQAIAR